MHSFIFHPKNDPGIKRNLEESIQESIYPDHFEVNITEGAEFLDDSLRMKDQPFGEPDEKENK